MSEYLALPDGAGCFPQGFSGPVVLRITAGAAGLCAYGALTRSGAAFQTASTSALGSPPLQLLQPRRGRNPPGLGSSPFARHYLGNHTPERLPGGDPPAPLARVVFSSSGYLDVSVPRVGFRHPMCSGGDDTSSRCRVAPFGHPRISARLQLPAAYRSLPRPSSPAHAQASSMRPSLLKPQSFTIVRPIARVAGLHRRLHDDY